MKILTNKQLLEIENQTLNKIYQALNILHERDNSSESGDVAYRHDELLDIALDVFYKEPLPENVYPWLRIPASFNKIYFGN